MGEIAPQTTACDRSCGRLLTLAKVKQYFSNRPVQTSGLIATDHNLKPRMVKPLPVLPAL